jgi:hypothetical protein
VAGSGTDNRLIIANEISVNNAKSRIQQAKDDILWEFGQISKSNGFRNDCKNVLPAIRPLDKITSPIEIGIYLGDRQITSLDDNSSVYDMKVDVVVQGVVSFDTVSTDDNTDMEEAVESLAQDMARVIAVIYTKYITATFRWNVSRDSPKIMPFPDIGEKRNKGAVILEFSILLRALGSDFK